MADEDNHEAQCESVLENWPHLMLLGLGFLQAWSWLSYNSPLVSGFVPENAFVDNVFYRYLVSTAVSIVLLLVSAVLWKPSTRFLDRRYTVVLYGACAAAGTLIVGLAGGGGNPVLFVVASALCGVGWAGVLLKAGRAYSCFTLSETLFGGCLALLLAVLLYFFGLGLPEQFAPLYLALLPVLACLVIGLPGVDPFPSVIHGSNASLGFFSKETGMLRKITIAACVVLFTAGISNGISSNLQGYNDFGKDMELAVLLVALVVVAVLLLLARNHGAHGLRMVYTLLMLAGIVQMLATVFGFPIEFLNVGSSTLWVFFFCFVACVVFKMDYSAVGTFGVGLALWQLFSLIGWIVGGLVAPHYSNSVVVTMMGSGMAFVVLLVLIAVFTEADVRAVVAMSFDGRAKGKENDELVVEPPLSSYVDPIGAVEGPETVVPADVIADDLSRVRDPRYKLSARELEILEPFAQGRSARWIADHYYLSQSTVRSHLRNVYTKLNVHTRQELLDFMAGRDVD